MDGTILLLPVKCATMCAYMSVLSHSPSFPPLQYNDIVIHQEERAPLAGTTAVAPNGLEGMLMRGVTD